MLPGYAADFFMWKATGDGSHHGDSGLLSPRMEWFITHAGHVSPQTQVPRVFSFFLGRQAVHVLCAHKCNHQLGDRLLSGSMSGTCQRLPQ